jgi:biopolymer transport protein ExbD
MFKVEVPEYQRQRPVIQLIPLIDILMFTLIFFMASSAMQQYETELSITVPEAAESKDSLRQAGEIIINVDKSGQIVVNEKRLDEAGLAKLLQRVVKLYPNQSVIIRADAKAYHESVVRVLDALAAANIWNISFSTVKEEPAAN